MRDDGPDFLRAVLERVRAAHPVDSRRMYVFGALHGAMHALAMAVPASEYFAAIAVDRGVLMEEVVPYLATGRRTVPIAMWADKKDDLFPLAHVRATRDVLNEHGFGVTLTEVAGHSGYGEVNRAAWEFLRKHHLDRAPAMH